MPVQPTYPGVYIEELPSGVRTITGVATSITGFVGKAVRGPADQPVTITSFADYERVFGGLHRDMTLSYAVRDFFLNGGGQAVIVRLYKATAGSAAKATLEVREMGKGQLADQFQPLADALRADDYAGVISLESVYHPGNGNYEDGFRACIGRFRSVFGAG